MNDLLKDSITSNQIDMVLSLLVDEILPHLTADANIIVRQRKLNGIKLYDRISRFFDNLFF